MLWLLVILARADFLEDVVEAVEYDAYFDSYVIPAQDARREPQITVSAENASLVEHCESDLSVRILDADRKLVIVGGGPAGLSAAVYASRADLQPLVIARDGGQLEATSAVDNYPGFDDGVDAIDLLQRLEKQAVKFGAQIKSCGLRAVDLTCRPFKATCDDGEMITSSALIVATGASPRWLEVPGEKQFLAKGVHTCATCDGYFYKDRDVAVVGGGDTAMEQALFLARICHRVTVVHRKDTFRATKAMATRVLKHPKILILWNTQVMSFIGDEALTGIELIDQGNSSTLLPVDAVFVAIGHIPNTELFQNVRKNQEGYIYTAPGSTVTSVPGVYAAGDVQDSVYRQAITSAGTGAMAAIDAERWLCEHGC